MDLKKKVYYQKCLDPVCRSHNFKSSGNEDKFCTVNLSVQLHYYHCCHHLCHELHHSLTLQNFHYLSQFSPPTYGRMTLCLMERTRICVVLLMKWRKQWLSDISGKQRELLTSIKNKICDAHNDSVPIQGNVNIWRHI